MHIIRVYTHDAGKTIEEGKSLLIVFPLFCCLLDTSIDEGEDEEKEREKREMAWKHAILWCDYFEMQKDPSRAPNRYTRRKGDFGDDLLRFTSERFYHRSRKPLNLV